MFSLFNVSNTVVLAGMVHCRSSVRPLCCTLRSMLWTHRSRIPNYQVRNSPRSEKPRSVRLLSCRHMHTPPRHTHRAQIVPVGADKIYSRALAGRILVFNVVTMPAELTLDFQSERKRSESIFGVKGPR